MDLRSLPTALMLLYPPHEERGAGKSQKTSFELCPCWVFYYKIWGQGPARVCFHHCMNSNTSFSSRIYQEGIFQHIKFNFKKKMSQCIQTHMTKIHSGLPQLPFPAILTPILVVVVVVAGGGGGVQASITQLIVRPDFRRGNSSPSSGQLMT